MRVHVPPALVRQVAPPVLAAWAGSWRVERVHGERWEAFLRQPLPRLVVLWHETLLPLLLLHRHQGISIVVSEARDGRYLADLAERIGYQTIGGSSHRGRVKAMRGTVRAFDEAALIALTPDGPRGPRRVMKPGAIEAVGRAGGLVLPVAAAARPARRLASWDRFMVPVPFARVRVAYGEPFGLETGEPGLARAVETATAQLDALEREIAWPDADRPIA